MSKELLTKAAAKITSLSAELAETKTKLAAAEAERVKLAQHIEAKTASDKAESDAAEAAKAKRVELAKVAAEKLFAVGGFATAERRDLAAAKIAGSHDEALTLLAKAADRVTGVPKTATVVVGGVNPVQSANDVWDAAARKHSPTGV